MLKLARSEPDIAIDHTELDRNPWLFNAQNGTIDLRTGTLQPHNKEDMITQLAPVEFDATATCPRWERFIAEIMYRDDPNEQAALKEFLQRLVGLWLSGDVSEHLLILCFGFGANGKSVFLNTVQELLGREYCMKAPASLLLQSPREKHPTAIASLFGKRLAMAIEIEDGKQLDEALVKELTGGDDLPARRMREDFWQFSPTHKLVIAANHKPVIKGCDEGIWRRIKEVPFTVVFPEHLQDKQLSEKLLAELPGILNWAIAGCLKWQAQKSLAEPKAVTEATAAYRAESDTFAKFLVECCEVGEGRTAPAGELYDRYKGWCSTNRIDPVTNPEFKKLLKSKNFADGRASWGNIYKGLSIKNDPV